METYGVAAHEKHLSEMFLMSTNTIYMYFVMK